MKDNSKAVLEKNMIEIKQKHHWLGVCSDEIDVQSLHDWVVRPQCGAVVVFSGTTRDNSENAVGVTHLEYEAYESGVVNSFEEISKVVFSNTPQIGRLAIMHRTGIVKLNEVSVVVAVSAPHRPEAFFSADFAIKKLKEISPIWKKEYWNEGSNWMSCK